MAHNLFLLCDIVVIVVVFPENFAFASTIEAILEVTSELFSLRGLLVDISSFKEFPREFSRTLSPGTIIKTMRRFFRQKLKRYSVSLIICRGLPNLTAGNIDFYLHIIIIKNILYELFI